MSPMHNYVDSPILILRFSFKYFSKDIRFGLCQERAVKILKLEHESSGHPEQTFSPVRPKSSKDEFVTSFPSQKDSKANCLKIERSKLFIHSRLDQKYVRQNRKLAPCNEVQTSIFLSKYFILVA